MHKISEPVYCAKWAKIWQHLAISQIPNVVTLISFLSPNTNSLLLWSAPGEGGGGGGGEGEATPHLKNKKNL